MAEAFFSPATAPFAVAISLMLMIAAAEIIGALMGMPASAALDSMLPDVDVDADLDVDLDIDADLDLEADYAGGPMDADAPSVPDAPSPGPLSQVLAWLCVGKVPVLVLLIIFLTAFGLVGFFVQGLSQTLIGAPLPALVAVAPAFAAAIPTTRFAGLTFAAIMPKEQTEAVSQRRFIGKVATIVRGEARKGLPAEAKFADRHGQTHYVLVEPDNDADTFSQGSEVVIVKQTGRSVYQAILNTSAAMSDNAASDQQHGNGGQNA